MGVTTAISEQLLGEDHYLKWFTPDMEGSCYTIVDLIAKFLYTWILGYTHMQAMSPEEVLRRNLILKQRANQVCTAPLP